VRSGRLKNGITMLMTGTAVAGGTVVLWCLSCELAAGTCVTTSGSASSGRDVAPRCSVIDVDTCGTTTSDWTRRTVGADLSQWGSTRRYRAHKTATLIAAVARRLSTMLHPTRHRPTTCLTLYGFSTVKFTVIGRNVVPPGNDLDWAV
jgi:hypothetical protein